MRKRCDRNRKRSRRRAIYCPIHECYLDSVSAKYSLYADLVQQLRERGMTRKTALMLVAERGTILLEGEWLEAFWCEICEETQWYHVKKTGDRTYEANIAPSELWQQVPGLIHPHGNLSVGEFTRRQARIVGYQG